MFTIKSIHAEPFTDKKGNTAIKLTLTTIGFIPQRERIIPSSAFADKTSVSNAIETVNSRISSVIQGHRIMWYPDLDPLYEKIKSIDKEFFTEDPSGKTLFKEVTALITDLFNRDFLLSQTTF